MARKRDEIVAKARQRHERKQVRKQKAADAPESPEGVMEQVEGIVATALHAVGHAATVAAQTMKGVVAAPAPSSPPRRKAKSPKPDPAHVATLVEIIRIE